jgi:hypothetical protein
MRRVAWLGWLYLLAAWACGGETVTPAQDSAAPQDSATPQGSATVSGTIDGEPVPANDAVGTANSGATVTSRSVLITSVTNACPCAIGPTGSTILSLTVGTVGTAVSTGTYSFPDAGNQDGTAEAKYLVNDPQTTLLPATSGSVTISQISASTIVGSFALSFASGDHVTGTFSAPTCATEVPADAGCP